MISRIITIFIFVIGRRSVQVKYSRQREAIMHFLEDRKDHPTADMIYAHLRAEDSKISLGTVYRNLSLLTELGRIRTIMTGDGKERYDPNTAPHSHFVCRKCGAVSDIDVTCPDTLRLSAQIESGGTVEDSQLYFFGVCGECVSDDAG